MFSAVNYNDDTGGESSWWGNTSVGVVGHATHWCTTTARVGRVSRLYIDPKR